MPVTCAIIAETALASARRVSSGTASRKSSTLVSVSLVLSSATTSSPESLRECYRNRPASSSPTRAPPPPPPPPPPPLLPRAARPDRARRDDGTAGRHRRRRGDRAH